MTMTWEAKPLPYDNGWGVGVDDGSRYYSLTRPPGADLTEAEATSITAQLNAGARAMQAPEPAPVPPEVWVVQSNGFAILGVYANKAEAEKRRSVGVGLATAIILPVQGAPTPDPLPEGVVRGLVLPAGVEPPKGIEAPDGFGWYVPRNATDWPRAVRLVEPPAPTPERVPWWEAKGRTLLDGDKVERLSDDAHGPRVWGEDGGFITPNTDGMVFVLPLEGEA